MPRKLTRVQQVARVERALRHVRVETSTPHINLFDVSIDKQVITLMGKDEIRFDDKEKAEEMLRRQFPSYLINWFEEGQ